MIKVIKASMRSCLGAFGLGKVVPKLKKGNGSIAIIHLMEVETALCLGFFFYLPLKQAHHFEKRIA